MVALTCLLSACASVPKGPTVSVEKHAPPGQVTVAVLEFEDHSVVTNPAAQGLGLILADRVSEDLAMRPGVRVIDRESLEKILEELSLSNREISNPEERLRLGKLLGAQYLIMGGFTSFGKGLRVDGRIVSVEKGLTLGISEEGLLEARNLVEREFSKKIADTLAANAGLTAKGVPATSEDFFRRGLEFEQSHENQKALEMYKKAVALDPKNREAKERLETLLLKELQ
jgi:TolB-like protein